MVYGKSLLVMLAIASAVVAGPCKPSTTGPVLSTTITAIEQTSTSASSAIRDTTVVDTATASDDTTTVATTTTAEADTTTITALTTTSAEADVTTTTTVAETTTTAPSAAAPTACGIYGYFAVGNTLQYLNSPGTKASTKDCLQACADYPECEVADYYDEAANGYDQGTCEFWKGTVKTNGQQTRYRWYQVSCLASM
ncbi:hypothetical protein FAGAP_1427 [Fusarium agapanthi]|uniref:Apple domain-containing protein n=1 Tax=Fusarium agapanthi TaxID=1803897 RepID=A0A9P5BP70_9HYPO|nr:hypothetical protein FAGAP_1427 [Fusarium agapanthi]